MERILQAFPSITLTDDDFNTIIDIIRVLLSKGELNENEPCSSTANVLAKKLGMSMSMIEESDYIVLSKGNISFECLQRLIDSTIQIRYKYVDESIPLQTIISILRGAGVLRIKDIGKYVIVLNSGEMDKLFNNVKSRVSGKVLIPLRSDSHFFIRRGDSLVKLERLGEVFADKYLLIPKDSLNDLILRVGIWESELQGKKEVSVYMYWYSPKIFLKPYDTEQSSTEVEPDELAHYHVDPSDRIKITSSVFRVMRQKDRDAVMHLSNIFDISELQVVDERGSVHTLIQDKLVDIGRRIGFEAVKEYDIGGFRLDVAWLEDNEIAYAFEIVISGSLIEALYRLNQVSARRILIVRDEDLGRAISRAGSDIKVLPASLILNGKIHEVVKEVLGGK